MHPDVRLLCVGEGPELEPAREDHRRTWARVSCGLHRPRPPRRNSAYLAAMDVSVAPYLPIPDFYFSPLKVVESLAAGTPVVASRIGQLEQPRRSWQNGLAVYARRRRISRQNAGPVRNPARRRRDMGGRHAAGAGRIRLGPRGRPDHRRGAAADRGETRRMNAGRKAADVAQSRWLLRYLAPQWRSLGVGSLAMTMRAGVSGARALAAQIHHR